MKLYKEDILKVGHTICGDGNGCLCIITNPDKHGLEEIILRNILFLFGDYRITETHDFQWDNGECDVEFVTDLPFSEFEKVDHESRKEKQLRK